VRASCAQQIQKFAFICFKILSAVIGIPNYLAFFSIGFILFFVILCYRKI